MTSSDRTRSSGPPWRVSLVALTLIAFAVRAHRLAAQSLWSDEDITLDRTGLAVSELLANLPVEHAPLYFVIMRGWTLLGGDGDLSLRLPSLLAGVVMVPLVAYLGARLVSRSTGAAAALIVAVNPFLVWYAQEARMYTLVGALTLGSLAAVVKAESTGRLRWWVAAGALAASAVLTHYYAAVIVIVLASWAAADLLAHRTRTWPGWATLGATAAVLYAPWASRSLQVLGFAGWREPVALSQVPWMALRGWSNGPTAPDDPARWTTWLYIVLALAGLALLLSRSRTIVSPAGDGMANPATPSDDGARSAPRPGRHGLARQAITPEAGARRALLYALLPVAIVTALLLRTPDFHPRYLIAALPAFFLLVGAGISALPRAAAAFALVALVFGALPPLISLYTDPAAQKQDYRSVIGTVEATAGADDTALVLDGPPFGMMQRYRADDSPVKIVDAQRSSFAELDDDGLQMALSERLVDRETLWLAEDGGTTGAGRRWMAAHACPVVQTSIQDITLGRYVHRPDAPSEPSMDHGLGTTPDLRVAIVSPDSVPAGDILPVQLVWRTDPAAGTAYVSREHKVSVRLVDDDGRIVAAADRRPVGGTRPTSTWVEAGEIHDCHALLVPESTAPRGYMLDVVLYDEETLEPLGSWRHRKIVNVTEPDASLPQPPEPRP